MYKYRISLQLYFLSILFSTTNLLTSLDSALLPPRRTCQKLFKFRPLFLSPVFQTEKIVKNSDLPSHFRTTFSISTPTTRNSLLHISLSASSSSSPFYTYKDYYVILGVPHKASSGDIQQRFNELSKQQAEEKLFDSLLWKEIQEAFDVLSNLKLKREYDQKLRRTIINDHNAKKCQNNISQEVEASRSMERPAKSSDFPDPTKLGEDQEEGDQTLPQIDTLFKSMFDGSPMFGLRPPWLGQKSKKRKSGKGNDIMKEISINFREGVFGCEKMVTVERNEICAHCQGSKSAIPQKGATPGQDNTTCSLCRGTGLVSKRIEGPLGFVASSTTCHRCGGSGEFVAEPCGVCGGDGLQRQKTDVKVQIPPGIDTGMSVKVNGEGHQVAPGEPSGDLMVKVTVGSDPVFSRQGSSIASEHTISYLDAILGKEANVSVMDGVATIDIPPGTVPGAKLRIAGKGVQNKSQTSGDHIVMLNVRIPKAVSKQEKDLLQKLRVLQEKAEGG